MRFTVGSSALAIGALGRMDAPGNTSAHQLKLVDAVSGVDVPNGSATIAMTGSQPHQYVYGQLANPVILHAGQSYLLVSQEVQGGDQWYDYGPVSSASTISVSGPAYWDNAGKYVTVAANSSSYGPLNLQMASLDAGPAAILTPTPDTGATTIITSAALTSRVRNDYSGWVGMSFQVGNAPLTIQALGRMGVTGNNGTHKVKLVYGQTGGDVPNASATVFMVGSSQGKFVYAPLASAVTLSANTFYLLVSQESAGGDSWYDYGSVSADPSVSITGPVYWNNTNSFVHVGVAGSSYVPLNMQIVSARAGGPAITREVAFVPFVPAGAPTIVHLSTTELPGETVLLFGDSFNKDGTNFGAQSWLLPNSAPGAPPSSPVFFDPAIAGSALSILQSTATSAKVLLPSQSPNGVFALQLWNASGGSEVMFINRAEVAWWMGGLQDTAYAGQTLRVFGRNLTSNLQGWLQSSSGTYPLALARGGKWSATFSIPSDVPVGSYSLYVHNGMGGNYGFSKPVAVTIAGAAPSWSTRQFNVINYGARGNDSSDDTAAFQNAIKDASANGGGIVYAPAGHYVLSQKLFLPSFTVLNGDGPANTTLIDSSSVATVLAGTSNFQVTNLTIQASAAHRVITCPDDPQMYNDWGLAQNPAVSCSNVTIDNVVIQHTTPDFVISDYELAPRSLHFFGSDIKVQNSTVHSKGIPTSFFNGHHLLLSNNHFFVGYYCADGFWNADQSVYEFNEHTAEPGTSGDGFFVQGTSKQLYFEGNNFHDSLGSYGEGIVAGDGPYAPFWYGIPSSSTASSITVANAGWATGAQVGHALYVIQGKGSYQRRYVVANTSDTLTLDSPLSVVLDSSSYVSLEIDHSDGIFYNNSFSNVSGAILLYSQSYGFVVDQNQGMGTGGSTCLAWNYDASRNSANPNANRWFNNCYFNEWTNNNFSGSLNASNPNKHGGPIPVIGKNITGTSEYIANTAVIGPVLDPTWMDQPQTENDYSVPVVGNIVRGNTMSSISEGSNQGAVIIGGIYNWPGKPLSCGWQAVSLPNGGAMGTLVESNAFTPSGGGIYFDPLFEFTLVRNNSFAGSGGVTSDASLTTCSGVSGHVPATASPFSSQP